MAARGNERRPKQDRAKMHADTTRGGRVSAAKQRGTPKGVARFSKAFAEYLKAGK